MMLSPSITSPAGSEQLFQIAAGFIPLAAATGTGFQLALIGKYRRYRWFVWALIANAAVWIFLGITGGTAISDVQRLPGFWYPVAGPYAWLALLNTVVISLAGFVSLGYVALTADPPTSAVSCVPRSRNPSPTGPPRCRARLRDRRVPARWLLSGSAAA
jgi:hypothetical protein